MTGVRDHPLVRRLETSFVGRCLRRFLEVNGIDRAMVIASQAFTSLIPLLILVSALAPAGNEDRVADAIVRRFNLSGDGEAAVREVFAHQGDSATGVLSVLILVFSGFSLARRMQRMYRQVWEVGEVPGVRGSLNAALGLTVLILEIALLAMARAVVRGLPLDGFLGFLLTATAGIVLWTSIPWLLLDRQLHWRRLLPGGALTAAATSLYGVATTIYMPHLLQTYSLRYGLFGVTLALVGWLLAIAMIVVAGTIVVAEFDRAPERWARELRHRLGMERTTTATREGR